MTKSKQCTPLPEVLQEKLNRSNALIQEAAKIRMQVDKELSEKASSLLCIPTQQLEISYIGCTGPIGVCAYDIEEDPICDCCLFCGQPYERK